MLLALLLAAGPALGGEAAPAPAVPRFVEETSAAGIDSTYAGGWEYMVGGGAAAFDCDADGFPELFLAGGEATAHFYRNRSGRAGPLRFERDPASGLERDAVTGAYPLDVDGDGQLDLALLRVGTSLLMHGRGDCRFEPANDAFGLQAFDAWTTAFSAAWERGAALPTLAFGTYVDRREEMFPWGSCTPNRLFRPRAGEPDRYGPPLELAPSFCALSMLFTDWNRSGTPALRVSNDREYYKGGQEQLWRLAPGEAPRLYAEAEGWKVLKVWGMGIASADLDGDRFPEYFLTSMADNKLQALKGPAGPDAAPTYADVALARGVTAHRPYTGGDVRPSTAWHADFADVNNDGRLDLFVAKGNVSEMPDFAANDPNNLLLQREDGTFEEAGDRAGVASMRAARGAVVEDLNLDGRLDLLVVNRNAPAELWRNASDTPGGFVAVRPEEFGPNRDAVGAWIELRRADGSVSRRELTVGGGHAGGRLGWRHFGLGADEGAEIRVLWPDGEAGPWQAVEAGGFYRLARGAAPQPWTPPR